jgi:hypothetical protein
MSFITILGKMDEIYDAFVNDIARGDLFKLGLAKREYTLAELEKRRCHLPQINGNVDQRIIINQGETRRYEAIPLYMGNRLNRVRVISGPFTPWMKH